MDSLGTILSTSASSRFASTCGGRWADGGQDSRSSSAVAGGGGRRRAADGGGSCSVFGRRVGLRTRVRPLRWRAAGAAGIRVRPAAGGGRRMARVCVRPGRTAGGKNRRCYRSVCAQPRPGPVESRKRAEGSCPCMAKRIIVPQVAQHFASEPLVLVGRWGVPVRDETRLEATSTGRLFRYRGACNMCVHVRSSAWDRASTR
jgi:hypothetical protein